MIMQMFFLTNNILLVKTIFGMYPTQNVLRYLPQRELNGQLNIGLTGPVYFTLHTMRKPINLRMNLQ